MVVTTGCKERVLFLKWLDMGHIPCQSFTSFMMFVIFLIIVILCFLTLQTRDVHIYFSKDNVVSVEWAKKIVPWEFHDDL